MITRIFRTIFGALAAFALVAAFTGAWHQLLMAAVCGIMWLVLTAPKSERKQFNTKRHG